MRLIPLLLCCALSSCGPSKEQIQAEAKAYADQLDAIADESERKAAIERKQEDARFARERAAESRKF